ncbi:MAG TPA: type II secretion system F family protein [Kiritimatiellia bacterium]|nr:type II secretion system F family protein [Kiritimatiellia bacterium]
MKTFAYRGFDRQGSRVRGLIEALDPKDAREKLAARGALVESLASAAGETSRSSRTAFPPTARAAFYRELGALLRAGVPAVAALDLLLESHATQRSATLMAGLRDRLREGSAFAEAFHQAGAALTEFEIALLQTGQRTGQLGPVMDQMAGYLEEQNRLREGIQSALLYPLLVVLLAVLIGAFMMIAILPRMAELFADTGVELPLLTRGLVWLGQDGRIPVLLASLLAVLLAGGLIRRLRQPARRVRFERGLARWPLIGSGFRLVVSVRFARTLVMLIRGGVSMVEGLALAGRASGSRWLDETLRKGAEDVRQGRPVTSVLAGCPWIGESIPPWYRAGEASGDLTGLLEQAARRYQEQWETLLQRFIRLVEPTLIIAVGGFVLIIAFAILLPILSLNQAAF